MHCGQEISTSKSDHPRSWDIFCKVVDNYGDIGVCWRLARQLAAEHGLMVRLWVDDLACFGKICPEICQDQATQAIQGIEIISWASTNPAATPADVVIEAFGCGLPASYVADMETNPGGHVWVNLEYLSAENWIDGCHGLPSPQTASRLIKYFFFPGFSPSSGGLICEKDLDERRREFLTNAAQVGAFWQSLGLPVPAEREIRVTLFCYEHNAATALFKAWSEVDYPVFCIVPEGIAAKQISDFFRQDGGGPGNLYTKGSLTVCVLHFLDQNDYDRLLWTSDFNLVRGEDSFVRAQWAARPMIWQIYPQDENAHIPKLEAFLTRYCRDLPEQAAAALISFAKGWNVVDGEATNWSELMRWETELKIYAAEWANTLMKKEDLATNLVHFCNNKLK